MIDRKKIFSYAALISLVVVPAFISFIAVAEPMLKQEQPAIIPMEPGKPPTQEQILSFNCKQRNPIIFLPRNDFIEMCLARELIHILPDNFVQLKKRTIEWTVRTNRTELGFRERREAAAIYNQFKLFPFAKYMANSDTADIYAFITINDTKRASLEEKFNQQSSEIYKISPEVSYRISEERFSVYNMRQKYRIVNILIENTGYIILYMQNIAIEDIKRFVTDINYFQLKRFKDHQIKHPFTIKKYTELPQKKDNTTLQQRIEERGD